MKQLISRRSFLKAAGVTAAAASMAIGAPAASACWYGDKSDVTILYTNDVHTYIDKQSPKLTYAAIADLKQSYQNAGKDVLLVDAGDHVQGTAYGSMDEGASIIKLMNAAGYDVATPGNHEFDYGMDRAKAIMKEADFPYLSCNWVDLRTTLRVLPSVKVFVRGGRRIAFVGVTTPETFTKSTPAYFMDKAQRKYIYDIQGGEDGKKLYDAVQKAIDKAKLLADVVIGLGHLGVDPSSSPWTSEEVIAHTSGFDAFIDGHSHTVMENKQVQDASGKAVTLTQTGSYFANVGEMTIAADGTITTKLIPTHEGMDADIAAMQTSWVNTVDDMLGEKIAVGDSDFYVSDPATGKRFIKETGNRKVRADAIVALGHPVLIYACEKNVMNKVVGHNMTPEMFKKVQERGTIRKFNTLKELADFYKIPYDVLEKENAKFNGYMKAKKDPDFDCMFFDDGVPNEVGPFYACRLWPRVHHCMGGLEINNEAQVIDARGKVIPNLYAAGEATGGVHGMVRLGTVAVADCTIFGRTAARTAVKLSKK